MNFVNALWTTINLFVYIIGLFGIVLYGIYDIWYATIIFLGILVFIICKYKDMHVFLFSIGIAISNYLSHYFESHASGVDGGFGGLKDNVEHITIAGWFVILTLIIVICLIVRIIKISSKKEGYSSL